MPLQNDLIHRIYQSFMDDQLSIEKNTTLVAKKAAFLERHKKAIIQQVFFNLRFNADQNLSSQQLERFKKELNSILPVFDTIPDFFKKGERLEYPTRASTEKETQEITARNYLRLFMRGSKVGLEKDWVWNSPLFNKKLIEAILKKGPHQLLREVRSEIQEYLDSVYETMSQGVFSQAQSKLVQKHLFPLLASLVFFDDPAKQSIFIPIKIGESWHRVEYAIEKLDVSPKPTDKGLDGMIAKYLDNDQDRFQMYGLTPVGNNAIQAKPILLLNGTPPPGFAGADLAAIHNFGIGQSVGESHNWDAINAWVQKRENIVVYGHSKGGSMAQIVAAENPDRIYSIDVLCTPGLHSTTLKRLRMKRYGVDNLSWDERYAVKQKNPNIKMPRIRIYDQQGDPVFYFEQGFLSGSEINHVITNKKGVALNAYPIPGFLSKAWEGHSFSSLGFEMVGYVKGSWQQENKRELRSYLDTLKGIKNYFITLEFKLGTYFKKVARSKHAWMKEQEKILLGTLFVATVLSFALVIGLGSAGIGFLAPLSLALASGVGATGSVTIMSAIALGLSAGLTYFKVIPKTIGFVLGVMLNIMNNAYNLVALSLLTVLSLPSAIKNGTKYLSHHPKALEDIAKYLVNLKFVADIVKVFVKAVVLLGKAIYVGAHVLKVAANPWYKAPSVTPAYANASKAPEKVVSYPLPFSQVSIPLAEPVMVSESPPLKRFSR